MFETTMLNSKNIGILINDEKPYKEFEELLIPTLKTKGMKIYYLFTFQNSSLGIKNKFIIRSRIARIIHKTYHDSLLWKNRDLSVSYKFRAIGKFGSNAQRMLNSNNFLPQIRPSSFLVRIIIRFISQEIFTNLMKVYLNLVVFPFVSIKNKTILNKIDILLVPYGARMSIEEDFAIWYAKKLNIKSVAIQENWDNLSSKKFIFSQVDYFITWGLQSTDHLRTFQNYKGETREFGCIRMQQFYKSKSAEIENQFLRNGSIENSKKKSRTFLFIGNGTINDFELLDFLDNYVESQAKAHLENTFFIFRPHPYSRVDLSNRLLEIKNNKITIDIPKKNEDNHYRLKLISDAEVVVGFYSTVLLESLIMEKIVAIPSFLGSKTRYKAFDFLNDSPHYSGISQLSNLYNFHTGKSFEDFLNNLPKRINDSESNHILNMCCENKDTVNEISSFLLDLI
jgi:hypothetical protein